MNTVAMKVNSANLVKGLKFSFTNKTTFLAELMQNTRLKLFLSLRRKRKSFESLMMVAVSIQ
jgi:hypothetical protein